MNSFFKITKALQLQETLMAVTAPNFHGRRTLRHYQLTNGNCIRRTQSMVLRLAQTPELLKSYGNIIDEHERCGFIERVDDVAFTDRAQYILHHAAKKDSATTPIRVVYDCSSLSLSNSRFLSLETRSTVVTI